MGGRSGSRGGGGGGGNLVAADLKAAQIKGLNARELKAAWKDTFGSDLTGVQQVYDLLGVSKSMLGPNDEINISGGRYGSALRANITGKEFFAQRTFYKGGHVSHDELVVRPSAQGKGLGTQMLQRATQSYAQLGIKSISLTAAAKGRYVWPKMGFRVSASDMRDYRDGFTRYLQSQGLPVPRRIHSVNQIARTTISGRQIGKEYLLSQDAPNVRSMSIRTRRLAQYLSSK